MSRQQSKSGHLSALYSRPLKITLAIILVIMVAEVIGGILSNSLALLGDAGHMLFDALALGLSLFAITIANRPATPSKTYGFHRVEIMAALADREVTQTGIPSTIGYSSPQDGQTKPGGDSVNGWRPHSGQAKISSRSRSLILFRLKLCLGVRFMPVQNGLHSVVLRVGRHATLIAGLGDRLFLVRVRQVKTDFFCEFLDR